MIVVLAEMKTKRCDAETRDDFTKTLLNQSISISACLLPDNEFPAPANGTKGFSSTTGGAAALAAADPLTEGVAVGLGVDVEGGVGRVRPERVFPEPTPPNGTAGRSAAACSAAEPGGGRRFSKPKKRFPKGRLSAAGTCRPPIWTSEVMIRVWL